MQKLNLGTFRQLSRIILHKHYGRMSSLITVWVCRTQVSKVTTCKKNAVHLFIKFCDNLFEKCNSVEKLQVNVETMVLLARKMTQQQITIKCADLAANNHK